MKRHIACCLLILGLQTVSYAQSRTHIFPNIADGFFPNGWYYTSTAMAERSTEPVGSLARPATLLLPPACSILEQHPGAGSSSDQTTREGQAGLP